MPKSKRNPRQISLSDRPLSRARPVPLTSKTWTSITKTKRFAKQKARQKKRAAEYFGQSGVQSLMPTGSELSPSPQSTNDIVARPADAPVSPLRGLSTDINNESDNGSNGFAIRIDPNNHPKTIARVDTRDAEIQGPYVDPASDSSQSEETPTSAISPIKRGQKTRLRHIHESHWNLFSPRFPQLCSGFNNSPLRQHSRSLVFRGSEPCFDQRGTKHWRFGARIALGGAEIHTDAAVIPTYPSTMPVLVLADMENRAPFEVKLTFLGVDCVKVELPLRVVQCALGISKTDDMEYEMVEFIGVLSGRDEGRTHVG